MPLSTSISALKSLFPVRARQEGGYDRFRMPNPNDPRELYGALANPSGDPSHVAGGMSANEYNAMQAEQAQARSDAERQDARMRGGLDRVVQGLKSVPTSRNWDAFFGALQTQGVDNLETGAAAGMDMGPSTYDMQTGASYQQAKPGFFDTQANPLRTAQDPRTARAGASSDAFLQHQARLSRSVPDALSGLQQAPYNPHLGVARRRHRWFTK